MSKIKFPKLRKTNILVKFPELPEEEDEDGLISVHDDTPKVTVVAVAPDCTIKVGEQVLISTSTGRPIMSVPVEGVNYVMFREADVEAIW